ncbi:MAG TPA: copper amine oxidase N-terminal domain-containing protein, partial [Epulopiscium sp.]|nr:copper amine oxidase N-terminal domain-containing protein [Candidatus Epulonipiscium sp.]
VQLNAATILRKENTMVPIKFIVESFGAEVSWESANSIIIIDIEVE